MKTISFFMKFQLLKLYFTIKNFIRKPKTKNRIPNELAKAIGTKKVLKVIQEKKNFYRVIFRTGIQHVYKVNSRRKVATMLF